MRAILFFLIFFIFSSSKVFATSLCSSHLLAIENRLELKLTKIGLKFIERPEFGDQFTNLEKSWREFDQWYDSVTNVGQKPLSFEDNKIAQQKNKEIIGQAKKLADALGMESKIVKLKDLWDISETSALEIINVDHPYFQELKKEFPKLRITWEPLRSFLSGGVRGIAGHSEDGEHIHLIDFPLFITDKVIHEILMHEVSHLRKMKKEMKLGDFYKNGKLLDVGGYIRLSFSEKPIQFYPEGFSFDELTAYLISLEEILKYYRMSFEIPADVSSNHPLRVLLNREALERTMISRIKIIDNLIKPAKRVTDNAYKQFKAERRFSPVFAFKGNNEDGLFYLTDHTLGTREVSDEILISAVEKNLQEKLLIIKQVAKRAFAIQNEFEQLKKTSP